VPSAATIPRSLIPHTLVTPKEVCLFSTQQSFDRPTSLSRVTNNRPNMKSLSPTTNAQLPTEQFSTILSAREYAPGSDNHFSIANLSPRETTHGLSTRLLNSKLGLQHSTPYKILCANKVIIIFSIQSDPLLLMRAYNINSSSGQMDNSPNTPIIH
jgi:hypothetical protein